MVFWATVCKPVRSLSDRCPVCLSCLSWSCLSVTLVYCGQTIGWIKMKLGMDVGLGPGHIVLDGYPAPPLPKGHSSPIFCPCLLWRNGRMHQDTTWYGGIGLGPDDIVLDGDSAPPKKGHCPQLSTHVYCGQTVAYLSYC